MNIYLKIEYFLPSAPCEKGMKKGTKGTPWSPLFIGAATRFARAYEKAFKVLSD